MQLNEKSLITKEINNWKITFFTKTLFKSFLWTLSVYGLLGQDFYILLSFGSAEKNAQNNIHSFFSFLFEIFAYNCNFNYKP